MISLHIGRAPFYHLRLIANCGPREFDPHSATKLVNIELVGSPGRECRNSREQQLEKEASRKSNHPGHMFSPSDREDRRSACRRKVELSITATDFDAGRTKGLKGCPIWPLDLARFSAFLEVAGHFAQGGA
ncbi:Phosducin [Anopheles sinensis]|uniref:Phosducin n=1 Tax=Anopheles sinensis TaxID=74873 RepID=A0A084VWR0_ANOSI|nr:Phosducin [Anopheles sinensis]